jgi:hypothetical protein
MAMDQFDRCAFATTACDTSFVVVAAVILMIGFSFDPPLALRIGGFLSFLFCLVLLYRLYRLERLGLAYTQVWKILEPHERPARAQDIRLAQAYLERVLMRFAKGAAGVACVLLATSLVA